MDSEDSSKNETFDLFSAQSDKLKKDIEYALKNSKKLSMSQIVETYYQVINATSLVKSLTQISNDKLDSTKINKIKESDQYIENKFNKTLHPLLISHLNESISTCRKQLKDIVKDRNERTKNEIENQAKMYEELRKIMSTKEFVEQYDKLLGRNQEN